MLKGKPSLSLQIIEVSESLFKLCKVMAFNDKETHIHSLPIYVEPLT